MKTDKLTRFNIAFRPPEEISKTAISFSQEIGKKYESFFILDGDKFFPHITIYSPEYPASNYNDVLKKVKEIASKNSKLIFKFRKIENYQNFIGVYFQLTPEIKHFHQEIVKCLNPLRAGHIRERYQTNNDQVRYSLEHQKNIKQYGYPYTMSLYNPHLTIIRLKDEVQAQEVSKNINWGIEEFTVEKIAIHTIMGKHGTCTGLLKKFTLK